MKYSKKYGKRWIDPEWYEGKRYEILLAFNWSKTPTYEFSIYDYASPYAGPQFDRVFDTEAEAREFMKGLQP